MDMNANPLIMTHWQTVHDLPTFSAGDIHIWRLHTAPQQQHLDTAYAILSQDEQVRANRFKVAHKKTSFTLNKY